MTIRTLASLKRGATHRPSATPGDSSIGVRRCANDSVPHDDNYSSTHPRSRDDKCPRGEHKKVWGTPVGVTGNKSDETERVPA